MTLPNKLPDELVLKIFGHLTPQTIAQLGSTSKILYSLTRDNLVWYKLYRDYFPDENDKKSYVATRVYAKLFSDTFTKTYQPFTFQEKKFISAARSQKIDSLDELNFNEATTLALLKKWIQYDLRGFRRLPQSVLDYLYNKCQNLITLGIDIQEQGYTHLGWAIIFNQTEHVAKWSNEARVDFLYPCTDHNEIPAILATRLDRTELLQEFINHHLEIHPANHTAPQATLLLHQAALADSLAVTRMLIAAEPQLVKTEDKTGALALHMASAKGHTEIMTLLLAHAPDTVNKETDRKETPMSMAALNNKPSAISLLLSCGADIERPERLHRSPLLVAIESDSPEAARCLLASGADANTEDEDHHTALERALAHRNDALAQALVQRGAVNTGKAAQLAFWNHRPKRVAPHNTTNAPSQSCKV